MAYSQVSDVAGPGTDYQSLTPGVLNVCNQDLLDEKVFVKVYFHIVSRDDGTGGYPINRLAYTKARMDAVFNPHNIFFLYDCYVDPLNNTDLYNSAYSLTQNDAVCLWKTEHQGKAQDGLHINIIWGGAGVTGLAGGYGSNWLVAVGDLVTPTGSLPDQRIETSTLHHEIGHCFGLFHLFHGSSKNTLVNPTGEIQEVYYDCQTGITNEYPGLIAEKVNGSNGAVAGDKVNDTGASHVYFETCNGGSAPSCVWDTGETWIKDGVCGKKPGAILVLDPNGDTYASEPDNFMATGMAKQCRTTFTDGQVCRMKNHLLLVPDVLAMTVPVEVAIQTCGCADEDWIVPTGPKSIASNLDLTGNMIIPAGADVTISAKVTFLPGAALYVERGGRLTIQGGRLTSFCPHAFWKGVRVQGVSEATFQPDADAPLNPNQAGIVRMMYGGKIELAETGIMTWDQRLGWPTSTNYFGGVIDASNAVFKNNKRAVAFMQYKYPNKSKFTTCTFETTAQMPGNGPGYGVTVWDCGDIPFINCTFKNLQVGVAGIDFESTVKGNSTFDNCVTGIGSSTTYPFGGSINVQNVNGGHVQFINNRTGISNRGSILQGSNAKFIKNSLYNHTDDAIGVQLLGPANFEVISCEFDNMNTGIAFRNIGDLEGAGRMECNTFIGDDKEDRVGLFGSGINSRVRFLYNEFDINDLCQPEVVLMKTGTTGDVVSQFIGADNLPADNCFSQNGKLEIQTIGNVNAFQYFTPSQGIACEYPHDNLSDLGVNNYTTQQTPRGEGNCRYSGVSQEETYTSTLFNQLLNTLSEYPAGGDGSAAYYALLQKKNDVRTFLIRDYRASNNNAGIIQILNNDNSLSAQRLLFGHYVYTDQLVLAMNKLLTLPLTSAEEQAFRDVQLINLDRLTSSMPYNLAHADYLELMTISRSDLPSAYYAQSLLDHLVAEQFVEEGIPSCTPPLRLGQSDQTTDEINILPNPSKDFVRIMINEPSEINLISFYNLSGQEVLRFNNGNQDLNISSLTSGVYIVKIPLTNGKILQQKFVKL